MWAFDWYQNWWPWTA